MPVTSARGRIDVFDGTFKAVEVAGGFADPRLPKTFAPFGIQAIGGDIYVTYAKQEEPGSDEEELGAGLGFVNVFDPQGHLIRRIASRGPLNRALGNRAGARELRSLRRRIVDRQSRRRNDQRLRTAVGQVPSAGCAVRTIAPFMWKGCGACSSATAFPDNRPIRCSGQQDRTMKPTARMA